MSKLSDLGQVLNGASIPKTNGVYPAYGGNGIIAYVKQYNYSENTIIIGRVGANCGAVYFSEGKCWVTDNALAFTINDNADAYFVYNLLKMLDLNKYHIGSSQPLITQSIINNIEFGSIPQKSIQKYISQCVKAIDDKISNNNRINAELESMAKTIYDYWFTQFDFPDENGKPYKSSGGKMVWNEELKREIPEGWGVGKLSDLCELINGRAYSQNELQDSGKYRILRVGNFFTNNSWYYSDMELEEDKYAIAGDLLYCWSASFGPSIWNYEKVIYHYHIWKVKCPEYNKLYVYELMKELTSQFVKSTHGSIMLHLTKDGMEKQTVLIPEHTVLQQFYNALSPIFEKIRINENENQQLASLRDWLLPMLMNGQVGFEEE